MLKIMIKYCLWIHLKYVEWLIIETGWENNKKKGKTGMVENGSNKEEWKN